MANKKISELTTTTTLENTDSFPLYDSGTAATRQITYANMLTELGSDLSVTQFNSDIDWNSNGLKLTSQTVGGSNGEVVYLSGSTTWSQADASAESTCKTSLGIRVSATEVLTHGVYTTTGLTAGAIYYVSETAGAITTTAPTTSTAIVRIVGYALSTTELFVDPDKSYIEVA